jgi:hypothetical protein
VFTKPTSLQERYTRRVPQNDEELKYYRAVEDFFAAARGVAHVLSPKDFQLLREWWRDGVPLTAVTSGIAEVIAKRRERDDPDPVVSLSYCRHAVRRHAKRLAEMHVGETAAETAGAADEPPTERVASLIESLRHAAERLQKRFPDAAKLIASIAETLTSVPDMPPAALEEHLYSLESVLLERCWQSLPPADRERITERSDEAAASAGADAAVRERTVRAFRDRELRRLLDLPRLEIW